jgi:general stress protein 26
VYETEEQMAELQAVLDRSFERLGRHASVILTPERRLTARQVVKYLEGMKHIVVGTVTPIGEPRVAPVDGHFLRGRFWFGTGEAAVRVRHLRRNPAISACHVAGDAIGIVIHGRAALFGPDDPEGEAMRRHFTDYYGTDPYTWPGGNATWVRIDPEIMTTLAMDPSEYPQ